MKTVKRTLLFVLKCVLGIAAFVLLYFLFAALLTWIPSNMFQEQPKEGVVIYLKSNGVHTDLVFPVHNEVYDWRRTLDTNNYLRQKRPFTYASIGWGDKGFYLNTPTWADLTFTTAFKAAFGLSGSAMHVSLRTDSLHCGEYVRKVIVSKEQYQNLVAYALLAFQLDENGKVQRIDHHYEGMNDNFYEAKGRYSLFKTCNVWTNNGLRTIGVKTATWAPFDKCVLYHFELKADK